MDERQIEDSLQLYNSDKSWAEEAIRRCGLPLGYIRPLLALVSQRRTIGEAVEGVQGGDPETRRLADNSLESIFNVRWYAVVAEEYARKYCRYPIKGLEGLLKYNKEVSEAAESLVSLASERVSLTSQEVVDEFESQLNKGLPSPKT